jgi:hypothetical protein
MVFTVDFDSINADLSTSVEANSMDGWLSAAAKLGV